MIEGCRCHVKENRRNPSTIALVGLTALVGPTVAAHTPERQDLTGQRVVFASAGSVVGRIPISSAPGRPGR